MKKLLLLAVVALPLLFTSCTKPEKYFLGTWTGWASESGVIGDFTLNLTQDYDAYMKIDYSGSMEMTLTFTGYWYMETDNEVTCYFTLPDKTTDVAHFRRIEDNRLYWVESDVYFRR